MDRVNEYNCITGIYKLLKLYENKIKRLPVIYRYIYEYITIYIFVCVYD